MGAGLTPVWGIERDKRIAQAYRYNIGDHCIGQPAEDVNIGRLDRPDILFASPPCQGFSSARSHCDFPHADDNAGMRLTEYIRILKPEVFILENVRGYLADNSPFWEILRALSGYFVWYGVLDSADFGVPQHRKRLFLIASRRLIPTLDIVPHVGWGAVIDESHLYSAEFSPAIAQALPEVLPNIALVDTQYSNRRVGKPRRVTVRESHRPAFTICAGHGGRGIYIYQNGEVNKLNTLGFAALQTFPENYQLPKSKQLAGKIIGNAVPPLMAQRILESVVR